MISPDNWAFSLYNVTWDMLIMMELSLRLLLRYRSSIISAKGHCLSFSHGSSNIYTSSLESGLSTVYRGLTWIGSELPAALVGAIFTMRTEFWNESEGTLLLETTSSAYGAKVIIEARYKKIIPRLLIN